MASPYALDTNISIAGLYGKAPVLRRLDALNPEDIVLCSPMLAELEYGARFSVRKKENHDNIKMRRELAELKPPFLKEHLRTEVGTCQIASPLTFS